MVNPLTDPTWRFMTLDWDGKIRMDCSSPYAMASLIAAATRSTSPRATTPTPTGTASSLPTGAAEPQPLPRRGDLLPLLPPARLASDAGIGKTLVSSGMIDRVAADLGRRLMEVPVGFKWFVPGLLDGSLGFGGEESAGASFLRRDGSVWTTDKDGLILALLAAEIIATTGRSPSEHYGDLVSRFGDPAYARVDAPASREEKAVLARLSAEQVTADTLAGEPITQVLTAAPGNGAALGGVKVSTESAWFAARPSGTEDVYKIYAESFKGPEHLARVQEEARNLVSASLS
ncbi:phosphoglucomutase [Streptosporangium lutulentum]